MLSTSSVSEIIYTKKEKGREKIIKQKKIKQKIKQMQQIVSNLFISVKGVLYAKLQILGKI